MTTSVPESTPRLTVVEKEDEHRPAHFCMLDFLQLACLSRRSVRVMIEGLGQVLVVQGSLWDAEDRFGHGYKALMRILLGGGLEPTNFARCFRLSEPGPRKISVELDQAILESARILDERKSSAAPEPELKWWDEPPKHPISGPISGQVATLERPAQNRGKRGGAASPSSAAGSIEAGLDLLLKRKYAGALKAFEEARQQGDDSPVVLCNIERLRQMGFG